MHDRQGIGGETTLWLFLCANIQKHSQFNSMVLDPVLAQLSVFVSVSPSNELILFFIITQFANRNLFLH